MRPRGVAASELRRGLAALDEHGLEILPIGALAEARDEALELGDVDEAEVEGDFLGAADLRPLSMFDRADELPASIIESWVPVSSQAKPRPSRSTLQRAAASR